jgi:hypothetical protein
MTARSARCGSFGSLIAVSSRSTWRDIRYGGDPSPWLAAGPDLLRTRAGRLLDQGVQAALDLNQDTLDRARRVLGADHPDTLISANNLAAALRVLGEVQAARELDEDTLGRRRRLPGEDHPRTIRSARTLARDLRLLGEAGEGC